MEVAIAGHWSFDFDLLSTHWPHKTKMNLLLTQCLYYSFVFTHALSSATLLLAQQFDTHSHQFDSISFHFVCGNFSAELNAYAYTNLFHRLCSVQDSSSSTTRPISADRLWLLMHYAFAKRLTPSVPLSLPRSSSLSAWVRKRKQAGVGMEKIFEMKRNAKTRFFLCMCVVLWQ